MECGARAILHKKSLGGTEHKSHTFGKAQGKILNVTCEDLVGSTENLVWERRNDKVWDLNLKTEKALETLATL